MPRTITVKGIGKVSAKPDYVVLSMSMESKNKSYDRAMVLASQHILHLTESIGAIGFEASDLKTTGFNVRTDYKSVKDLIGNLSIAFTVKDPTAINEEMLRSAAANAKRKAEILCEASGVELGQLLTIDYNWGELNIFSHTEYGISDDCLCEDALSMAPPIDIEPDDIDVSDTAAFVWEIK